MEAGILEEEHPEFEDDDRHFELLFSRCLQSSEFTPLHKKNQDPPLQLAKEEVQDVREGGKGQTKFQQKVSAEKSTIYC